MSDPDRNDERERQIVNEDAGKKKTVGGRSLRRGAGHCQM